MIQFLLGLLLGFGLVWVINHLTGFASQKPDEYAGIEPALDLRRHLDGHLLCDGMIFGPTGRVTSRFQANMRLAWNGPKGVMDEHFDYDDGTTQQRAWHLTIGNDGSVRAEADDVIGAGRGRLSGNTLELRYRIRLPDANGGHVLDAVDWMYLQPDGAILNRSQFRKFGVKVAELFCTIRPIEVGSGRRHA